MVVAFDPGHGGEDPGARHHDVLEKTVNLLLAQMCREALRCSSLKVWPVLTREDDTLTTLKDRGRRSTTHMADLVISIHCNAHEAPLAKGLMCFVPAADIVAAKIGEAILGASPRALKRKQDTPVVCDVPSKGKPLWTDRAANVLGVHRGIPAVLVEVGFLSNEKDAAYLSTPGGRLDTCKAILEGVEFATVLHAAGEGNL